jgi:hypothetical protein
MPLLKQERGIQSFVVLQHPCFITHPGMAMNYETGMFANSNAKFWVDYGKKSLWVEGKMHEYYSAKDRNRNSCVCSNAVCSCMKRSKGMYRITYKQMTTPIILY